MYPNREEAIIHHRQSVSDALDRRDFDQARLAFNGWIEALKQQNVNTGGSLDAEVKRAKDLFSNFAKTDPIYIRVSTAVIDVIAAVPGILQTDLYTALPTIPKQTLSYVLFFAESHGRIRREKKGRTHQLFSTQYVAGLTPDPNTGRFVLD